MAEAAPKTEDKVEDVSDVQENQESEGTVEVTLSPEEQRAESFGWMPKEKWIEKGNTEDDWVPAKHFLKFGELKKEVVNKDKILQKQEKVIKKMKDHHLSVKEQAYNAALAQLRKERQSALDDGDIVAAEKIRDRIDATKEQFAKAPALPPEIEQELQTANVGDTPPEFYEFHDRNPWYESDPSKQDEMSREADIYGATFVQRQRLAGKNVTPSDVYQAVEKFIRKAYPDKFETPKSPVGDTPSRSGPTSSRGASKLTPQEAEIAKAFGLTEKQYLDELKSMKKGGF